MKSSQLGCWAVYVHVGGHLSGLNSEILAQDT